MYVIDISGDCVLSIARKRIGEVTCILIKINE